MSLFIDSRKIVGIYALGQWFNVKPNTLVSDAFELVVWEEDVPFGNEMDSRDPKSSLPHEPHSTCYQLGASYHQVEPDPLGGQIPYSNMKCRNPSGSTGISFVDADTALRVSMSLLEVKAYKETSIASAIASCPSLDKCNEALQ
jgi:hypothetical protein